MMYYPRILVCWNFLLQRMLEILVPEKGTSMYITCTVHDIIVLFSQIKYVYIYIYFFLYSFKRKLSLADIQFQCKPKWMILIIYLWNILCICIDVHSNLCFFINSIKMNYFFLFFLNQYIIDVNLKSFIIHTSA